MMRKGNRLSQKAIVLMANYSFETNSILAL
jgi:hypothetical protein